MNRKRILIVEDDLYSKRMLKFMLRDEYDLEYAVSFDEAMSVVNNTAIDLILLDLALEGDKDGIDIVKELKKKKKYQDLPVIAETAHVLSIDKQNALNAGCIDYLTKPITKKVLLDHIYKYI